MLGVDIEDESGYMKYFAGLNDYVCRKLKLFDINNITDAMESKEDIGI